MEEIKSFMTLVIFLTTLALLVPSCFSGFESTTDPRLSWTPPQLDHPITVDVSASNHFLRLDPTRDYLVRMPTTKLSVLGGLVIVGGHNVVLVGGAITIPSWGLVHPTDNRGLYLKNQTGTVHVEGLHERDEVHFSSNHPDLIQSWAGPAELRVDRFTGTTDYQGIYLAPQELGERLQPRRIDLRRVNIETMASARYLLWQVGTAPLRLDDVWIRPSPGRYEVVWPDDGRWDPVVQGDPPGGDFVGAGEAGLGYRSPGYLPKG